MDRLLDLYFLILLGAFGVYYFFKGRGISLEFIVGLVIFLLIPLIILNPKFINLLSRLLFRKIVSNKYQNKLDESVNEFSEGMNQIINPGLSVGVFLTVISYSIFFFLCYLVAKSIGLSISYFELALIMSIVNLITFIPISISGLGTREASMIFLFKTIGLSTETAVSYSFLIFFTSYICGGLRGFIAWWFNPLQIEFLQKKRLLQRI